MPIQSGVPIATAYVAGTGTSTATNGISIKPTNGVLFTLSVTGAATTITIYDSLVSSAGAILNTSNIIYSTTAGAAGLVVLFNMPFQTGLALVATSTGVPNLAISFA